MSILSPTIAEAEMLAQCNAPDVLLAYQPLGPKLNRFVSLIKKYPATKTHREENITERLSYLYGERLARLRNSLQ